VDHATIQRWVFKFTPLVEQQFRKRKKLVGKRWRLDETYIKVKGQCKYLNNIVEQDHQMIKWRIMLGLGFKEFESAKRTISGIEVVRMIKKNQL